MWKIDDDDLQKKLKPHGCILVKNNSGLWKHIIRPKMFILYFNGFGYRILSGDDEKTIIETLYKY